MSSDYDLARLLGMSRLIHLVDIGANPAFSFFKNSARVVSKAPIEIRHLDDLAEVDDIDFLKVGIQGGELAVLSLGLERDQAAEAQGACELLDRLDRVPGKLDPLLPTEQLQQYEHTLVRPQGGE